MYLAIDIGGSKTLIAIFDANGKITKSYKFPTPKEYPEFIKELKTAIEQQCDIAKLISACCALPGRIDRSSGIGLRFGNLPWRDVPMKHDLENILGTIPIYIENDAKLAALSEALVHSAYKKALYVTVSTGIGTGLVIDGKLDPEFLDMEGGRMMIDHEGKIQKWESFASGRALYERYGKRASEIDDPAVWQEFSRNLALGLNELIAVLSPDIIIIGGGVGAHYEKFASQLQAELNKLKDELVVIPPILKASRPEEAVVYGCYDYIQSVS